jgi:hypothetical protein
MSRIHVPPAIRATLKGAEVYIHNKGLQSVILAAQLRPGAAPRVLRAQRPGRAAVSRAAGTTAFSYDLRGERHPYLCEAFLGVCLVKLHPHERVIRLGFRDEGCELLELLVGAPKVLQTALR